MAINLIEVLQIVGAGIAFMLALLAYRLLAHQGKRENVDQRVLNQINRFMIFAFALGVLAIGAQVFNIYTNRDMHIEQVGKQLVLGNKTEPLAIRGGSIEAGRCPDGYVITGVASASRAGGEYAGLALVTIEFICSKIELVTIKQ